MTLVNLLLQPWLGVLWHFHSVMDSEATQYATPQPPKLASSTDLFFPFSSFLPKKTPVPVEWLALCGPSTVPFLSLLWRVTPVPLAPAPLPGPYRNALGLVIAFVGAIELYGWLKLPNLTARWPLNGAQRGAALQTTDAAKFLQWRSTITPTQAPIYRQAEGTGRGLWVGMVVEVVVVSACVGVGDGKTLHLTPNKSDTSRPITNTDANILKKKSEIWFKLTIKHFF